jgi:hypothetical protein
VKSLGLGPDIVILACAISAGIHGALVPVHFDEGTGAGLGFVAATVLLTAVAAALTLRPASPLALACAVAVLLGLLASYLLAVTSGLPILHPDPEPVDGLALATKTVEAVGLLAAATLLGRPWVAITLSRPEEEPNLKTTPAARPIPIALTALVAFFSALSALAVSNGHGAHAYGNTAPPANVPAAVTHPAMALTQKQAGFGTEMRRLLDSHSTWTHA